MKIVNCGYDYHHPKGFRIHRPHGSGDCILLIIRSPASITVQNKVYEVKGNAVILFQKGSPQFYGSNGSEYINDWIHFECDQGDIDFLTELGIEFDKVLELRSVKDLSFFVKQLYFEKYSNNKNAKNSADLYFKLILLKLSDLCEQRKIADTEMQQRLISLKNRIFSYPQEDWNIEKIARQLSISRSYLQHQYKAFFNTGIKRDVTLSRLEYSKYLLFSTDYTISIIANMCGYENDVHFMRIFKKETGVTPTEYRKTLNYSHSQVKEAQNRTPFSL